MREGRQRGQLPTPLSVPATLGPWLEIDRKKDCFKNPDRANELVRGDYREPYVVPEVTL